MATSTEPAGAVRLLTPKLENTAVGLEIGVLRSMPTSTWGEWISEQTTNLDLLVEMRRRDGQARALIYLLSLPVLASAAQAEWIEPEGGDAAAETDFANLMFTLPYANGGMQTPFIRILRETLLALVEGFSAFEEVRYIPRTGPLKGKVSLRRLAHRDSRTLRFLVNEQGEYNGLRQVASLNGRTYDVYIPSSKSVYFAVNEEENPFYGASMFEAASYHYSIKKKLYYITHLASQFAAVPGRLGTTPVNPDPHQLQAFKQALADFAFNTAMVMPTGYTVTPFNGNTGFNFIELINHHNQMMSRSVLSSFIDQESRQVLIDNGKGDATSDALVMTLEAIMVQIADVWTTQLMPKYIDWNFGTGNYPVFKFPPLADSTRDMVKEIFTSIVQAGTLNCTPEFVRELEKKMSDRIGLDIDYEQIEQMELQEAYAAAQQQAQQQAVNSAMAMMGGAPPEGGAPPGGGGPPGGGAPPAGGGAPPEGGGGAPPAGGGAPAPNPIEAIPESALNPYASAGAKRPGALPGPATAAGQQLETAFNAQQAAKGG